MFVLTKQERLALSLFIAVLFAGAVLNYLFTKHPALTDIVNLIDSERIYFKVNINTADLEELVAIPYIGEYTARNIIQYRRQNGLFTNAEQIKKVKGIREKNFDRFKKHITIQ